MWDGRSGRANPLNALVSRLGGGFELNAAQMDLGSLCEQIAAELRLGASASVNVNVNGDVAGTWDEARLGEVISNVAGNAVEHGDPGTAVDIDVSGAGDAVTIAITNRGPTIDPESMREISSRSNKHPRRASAVIWASASSSRSRSSSPTGARWPSSPRAERRPSRCASRGCVGRARCRTTRKRSTTSRRVREARAWCSVAEA